MFVLFECSVQVTGAAVVAVVAENGAANRVAGARVGMQGSARLAGNIRHHLVQLLRIPGGLPIAATGAGIMAGCRVMGAVGSLDDPVGQALASHQLAELVTPMGLDFEHGLKRPIAGFDERHTGQFDGVPRRSGRGTGEHPANVDSLAPFSRCPDCLDDLA
jgi:hypothetical protein